MFPGRLHAQGTMFLDAKDRRWIWKGFSDFTLFQRVLDGQNIDALLQERQGLGVNTLRVFCMYDGGLGRFHPRDYPRYDAQMQEFINRLGVLGLRMEWVVLADCQRVMPDVGEQRAFVEQVVNRCRGWTNCFVSLGNEWPQNGWNPDDFTKPTGGGVPLFSFGSNLGDSVPPRLAESDYREWHGRRDWPKVWQSSDDMVFVAHGWQEDDHGWHQVALWAPTVHDEPIGFAEVGQDGRRSDDPDLARTLALSSLAYGAGATFHCDAGVRGELMGPRQRLCAQVFFDELRPHG